MECREIEEMTSALVLAVVLSLAIALTDLCSSEPNSPLVLGTLIIPRVNNPFNSLVRHIPPTPHVNVLMLKYCLLVPGILGNQIEAKLNKTSTPHFFCFEHTKDYVTLWLSIEDLLPDGAVDCLSDNLRYGICLGKP